MSYSSKRVFKIWAYSVSHSFLLLRSTYNEENGDMVLEDGFNIDVEFSGVGYLDLPVILEGFSIREIKDNLPDKAKRYKSSLGFKFFEITSNSSTYFIVAGNYEIGKNNWTNEDRILNPFLEHDEILDSSNL